MARSSRGPLSLPRTERLRGKAQIQTIFEHGKRREHGSVAALWLPRPGPARVAFAVSRRVGGSVRRNRARRRLREAYRRLRPAVPAGVEIVFIGRAGVFDGAFSGVVEAMQRVVEGIGRDAARRGATG